MTYPGALGYPLPYQPAPASPWASFRPVDGTYFITPPSFGRLGGQAVSLTNNWTTIAPAVIPWDITFDRVGVHVGTAAASTTVRPVVYDTDEFGLPVKLIKDWGTVASTTTGQKDITVDDTLLAGIYWIGVCQTGGAGVAVRAGTSVFPFNASSGNAAANGGRIDISSGSTPLTSLSDTKRLPSIGNELSAVVLFRIRSTARP